LTGAGEPPPTARTRAAVSGTPAARDAGGAQVRTARDGGVAAHPGKEAGARATAVSPGRAGATANTQAVTARTANAPRAADTPRTTDGTGATPDAQVLGTASPGPPARDANTTSAPAARDAGDGAHPGKEAGVRTPASLGSVDVVLPCLDEAEALPWVLGRIPDGWRAIVVDNGSGDGSAEIAAALGATVVREPRRGFGAACHAGLLAAEAEFVCFCDCDASLDPGLLPAFVREIADGGADLVLGRRRPVGRGAWPPHARAGNLAVARLLRRRTGLRLHDIGPLRAARREALLALPVADRRSGYPLETVVRAAEAGWHVAERPVPYHPRTGASKVTGTWRGTWQAVQDMARVLADLPPGTGEGRPR
jgi:hypothetical protein